jgi:methylenetetrahydrofolate dehydrogenase (NADP+)/methenyltetrahydrofolate cyclohydrolase
VGISSIQHELPASTTQAELAELLAALNEDEAVSGILLQLPVPDQIDGNEMTALIDPLKDVDGLTPLSAGRLFQGLEGLVPCTPAGVMELLRAAGAELEGAEAVVIGCRRADVLVAAAGVPRIVTADMVREGAIVVDVGIHRTDEGLIGDVDFEAVRERASAITPVPGGVGPMTIAMLLANTLKAARLQSDDRFRIAGTHG